MANQGKFSRRSFLAKTGRTAAVLGAGSFFTARTARAATRQIGANDRIVLGVIGAGGQGLHDCTVACTAPNVVCGALCDLAEFRMDHGQKTLTDTMSKQGVANAKIDRYNDYRKLLERKDIDGVVIATPDFWHAEPFIAACEAGKHIYQEKPFSFTIEAGEAMLAAAGKQKDLTIQIGTQRRSQAQYAAAKEYIDAGKLGTIGWVRAFDCRNYITAEDPFTPEATAKRFGVAGLDYTKAKIDWDQFQLPCQHKVAFDPIRYTAWRWYWDYAGGLVTDVGVHVIDNVHWLMGEPVPKSAVCNGGVYGVKYWETPDVVNAVIDYGTFSLSFTGNFTNGFEGDGFLVYGTKGTMEVRGNDIKVWAEGQHDKPVEHWEPKPTPHQHNWISCIRSGEKTNAPVELGVSSLLPSHMSNLAYRTGKRITWDPQTRKAS
jgi:predicted dehydrogenase